MAGLRRMAIPIGIVATVLLVALFNPWVQIDEGTTLREVLTIAFWVSFILLLLALFEDRKEPEAEVVEIEGPRFVRFLFSNTRAGLFWLPIRLFLGFAWVEAGWHKLTGGGWIDGGTALAGFWKGAVAIPDQGRPADQLRVVSRLHQLPAGRPPRDVVRAADHVRRARGRRRACCSGPSPASRPSSGR